MCQGPSRSGRSRHGAATGNVDQMPSMTRWWSAHGLPRPPALGSGGSSTAHVRSANSLRPTTAAPPTGRTRGDYRLRTRFTSGILEEIVGISYYRSMVLGRPAIGARQTVLAPICSPWR